MANVMNMTKLRNKPSRNGFDLSRKVAFTAKIAELLPIECIECIPGDSFKIRKQHFTRTMPVNTAAYTRVREYYDWFFVPTNLLWNKFNTFVSQMTDNGQHATSISDNMVVGQQHPYFTTTSVTSYVAGLADPYNTNIFGYNRSDCTRKLLEYLGYKQFYKPVGYENLPTYNTNVLLNPFPLLAYQKIYQDYFRNSQWEKSYAPAWNIDYMKGSNMELPLSNIDKSVENMFDLRYCNWNKDYFMGLLPNSQYGSPASVDLSSIINPQNFTNLRIRSTSPAGTARFASDTSQAPFQSVLYNDGGGTGSSNLGISATSLKQLSDAMGLTSSALSSAFTILALRQAEAAQKWAEITQSQQQDYKSQMEAHFGVDLSDAYSERCRFIDGQVSNLDISEVVNQSVAEESANIKGKGVGVGDGYINFKTDVHGYLMCIYHAVPILDYQTTGLKKQVLKTMVTDYAIPEFDRTGMVKMQSVELFSRWSAVDNLSTLGNIQLGYAPQYYEYKTNYDEVIGAFAHGGLTQWVAPFNETYIYSYFKSLYEQGIDSLTYHFFKVNPSVMNPIFVAQVTEGNNDLSTDQLLINCSFDTKAVRNLDYNGLPY